jgi:hypothetical protein
LFTGIVNHENIEMNDNHAAKKNKKEVIQKVKKESRKAVPEPNKGHDSGVRFSFGD